MTKTLPERLNEIIEALILAIEAHINGGPLPNRLAAPAYKLVRNSLRNIADRFAAAIAAGLNPAPPPPLRQPRAGSAPKSASKPLGWRDRVRAWFARPSPQPARAPHPKSGHGAVGHGALEHRTTSHAEARTASPNLNPSSHHREPATKPTVEPAPPVRPPVVAAFARPHAGPLLHDPMRFVPARQALAHPSMFPEMTLRNPTNSHVHFVAITQ